MTYGYNNGSSDAASRKKKLAIMGVSSIILVAMVVAVAVGVNEGNKSQTASSSSTSSQLSTSTKSIQAICQPTDYKETCQQSLAKAAGNSSDPHKLVQAGFQVAIDALTVAIQNSTTLKEVAKDPLAQKALDSCKELMDQAIDDLKKSFDEVGDFDLSKVDEYVANLKVWLSATITYQESCLDGFQNATSDGAQKMKNILKTSSQLTSNGLAMIDGLSSILKDFNISALTGRKLLQDTDDYPRWLTPGHKRILAQTAATIKPNMIVAQDGSGQYKTINEAIPKIPKGSATTFVVYVKAGVYKENIIFSRSLTNIMLIGDGPAKTKITGNLSFADGIPPLKTATVSISGGRFMAKDIGFENTAALGHQAVALRVQSDMSVFYNCQIDGFQASLYAHTYRQFYRDCTISGIVDTIIGDAAAVFQNCKVVLRAPMEDRQKLYVTAQQRNDTREPTGFVLQNCTITAEKQYFAVQENSPAFLGRPVKEYSRTIVMQSNIDSSIDPKGWGAFMGTYGTDTCSFSEYQNRGPGADTKQRVAWKGIVSLTAQTAEGYTAGKFLEGDSWIPATGVPYTSGMMKV